MESEYGVSLNTIYVSECFSCRQLGMWLKDRLIYPLQMTGPDPNADMPESVRPASRRWIPCA